MHLRELPTHQAEQVRERRSTPPRRWRTVLPRSAFSPHEIRRTLRLLSSIACIHLRSLNVLFVSRPCESCDRSESLPSSLAILRRLDRCHVDFPELPRYAQDLSVLRNLHGSLNVVDRATKRSTRSISCARMEYRELMTELDPR